MNQKETLVKSEKQRKTENKKTAKRKKEIKQTIINGIKVMPIDKQTKEENNGLKRQKERQRGGRERETVTSNFQIVSWQITSQMKGK